MPLLVTGVDIFAATFMQPSPDSPLSVQSFKLSSRQLPAAVLDEDSTAEYGTHLLCGDSLYLERA